jgi:hypothetical protein
MRISENGSNMYGVNDADQVFEFHWVTDENKMKSIVI